MIKHLLLVAAAATGFLGDLSDVRADDRSCVILGGTGLADAIDANRFVANLSGSFAGGARADVLAERKTSTGFALDMEHFFFTDKGGLLRTVDKATLTPIPGKGDVYMLEIDYAVKDSAGAFEGFEGSFRSFGIFDKTAGKIVLRYQGEICAPHTS